ncbi:pyridoxal-phosphate dependent enzyme, partial [Candidatus Peregrinibacteria bacterium]|nr:pyridoxal-phosphate dependent enzyme [Candidatus Peregrinibacteria bacterium]
ALTLAKQLANKKREIYLMNSVNPIRLEGQKTIAFEIYEQLGRVPDIIVMPIGNAGNIRALWKGFRELVILGLTKKLPRVIGVQAKGAAPIVKTLSNGAKNLIAVKNPETVATAIRIGAPVNWRYAVEALKSSKGFALSVSDSEILQAQRLLSSTEGVFVEPASASPLSALNKLAKEISGKTVVCIATGNGLKDPEAITKNIKLGTSVKPDLYSLEKALLR